MGEEGAEHQAAEIVLSAFRTLVEAVQESVPSGRGYAISWDRPNSPVHVEAGYWISTPNEVPGSAEYDIVILFQVGPATSWLELYLDVIPAPDRDVAHCSIESPVGELEDVLKPAILPDKALSPERYDHELREYAESVADYISDRTPMIIGYLRDLAIEKLK